jgi:putative glutamine amidotransferase
MQPRIAIPEPKSEEAYVRRVLPEYAGAVSFAGGEPVVVPLSSTPAQVAQMVKSCAGILLPGSPADLDPQKYGEARDPHTAPADPAREMVDDLLLQDAHNMRKPILGICFGIQSLNVWRTGTLLQHIESPVKHERPDDSPQGTVILHPAVLEAGSRLAAILGQPKQLTITVNSSHHQAVALAGDGLRIVARSPEDGIIEAVEGTADDQLVLGVQWHPERTYRQEANSEAIFSALVEAARRWHRRMAEGAGDFETAVRR